MATTVRKRYRRPQEGQALLEMALVTPLLLALALGVIELGRYAYVSILVGSAARAGAGYGAQGVRYSVDSTGIQQAADNDFQNNGQDVAKLSISGGFGGGTYTSCGCDNNGAVTPAGCTAASNPTAGTCPAGHWVVMVSVQATGTFNSLFNYPGIPKSITVDRTATMRVAQQ